MCFVMTIDQAQFRQLTRDFALCYDCVLEILTFNDHSNSLE